MRRNVVVVVVIAALAAAAWWFMHRGGASPPASHGAAGSATTVHGSGPLAPVAPASLAGTITDATNHAPIVGAVVSVRTNLANEMFGDSPPIIVSTNASGAWVAAKVPPGQYAITVTAVGHLPGAIPKIAVAAGEQRSDVDLALAAGGTLVHGTVSDVGGGPVAGAHIAIVSSDHFDFNASAFEALTAADGTYQVSLADGTYAVSAQHDDYTSAHHTIEVAGKPVVRDFTLTPGAVIRGQVIGRDTKRPVPFARVAASTKNRSRGGGGASATADAEGNFVVKGLHAGAVNVTASGRGYASASPTVVEIGIGEQIDGVRVLVDHAFSISGTVIKRGTKTGVPGVHIGVFSMSGGGEAQAPDPSNDQGKFEIVGVKPGSYMLFAVGDEIVPEIGKPVEVVDKDVTDLEVEMTAGVTLTGRVQPPARASISIGLEEVGMANLFAALKTMMVHAESDATTGEWKLVNVPPGAFKLTARTADGHVGTLPLTVAEVDQHGLIVTLEARASVAGRVVDTNNAPAAGIRVQAVALDEQKQSNFSIAMSGGGDGNVTTGDDGSFKLVGLEAGKYRIAAAIDREEAIMERFAKDKKKSHVTEVELAAGAERTGVVVTIEARDGVIRGQVIGSDKHPAIDAWLSARPAPVKSEHDDGNETRIDTSFLAGSEPVLTGPDGKFTIDHLRRGEYIVTADGPRGTSRAEKTGVKTGDTVTIELAPLGTLSGHVMVRGTAVATYEISCHGPAGPVDRNVTAADGAYSLEHLAPGAYDCTATGDAGTAEGKIDVPAGAATLELQLVPWASLTGVVVSMFTGAPIPNLNAMSTAMGGKMMADAMSGKSPTTDASGRFVIERVAAGSGAVMIVPATSFMKPLATQPYTVAQGERHDLGTIKVVPPRQGDAGTLGMSLSMDATLTVASVKPGGPAAAAGIQVGDKVTSIDGHTVAELTPMQAAGFLSSGQIGVGEVVQLVLDRGGQSVSVTITSVKW